MRAFDLVEIDQTLLVVVNDPRLAAVVRALNYAYEEGQNEDGSLAVILEALGSVYCRAAGMPGGCLE